PSVFWVTRPCFAQLSAGIVEGARHGTGWAMIRKSSSVPFLFFQSFAEGFPGCFLVHFLLSPAFPRAIPFSVLRCKGPSFFLIGVEDCIDRQARELLFQEIGHDQTCCLPDPAPRQRGTRPGTGRSQQHLYRATFSQR